MERIHLAAAIEITAIKAPLSVDKQADIMSLIVLIVFEDQRGFLFDVLDLFLSPMPALRFHEPAIVQCLFDLLFSRSVCGSDVLKGGDPISGHLLKINSALE